MSHRTSLAARIYCHIGRFVRRSRPVRLGQSPAGSLLAAAIIMLWGLERPAVAVPLTPIGSVENQHFVLEWDYDLSAGIGSLTLDARPFTLPNGHPGSGIGLESPRFSTRGAVLEPLAPGNSQYELRLWQTVGQEDGIPIFEYHLCEGFFCLSGLGGASGLSGTASYSFALRGAYGYGPGGTSAILPLQLATTQLIYTPTVYEDLGQGASRAVRLPEETLEFVTVQAIPEPATIALAGIGAAVVGAVVRRRNNSDDSSQAGV